MSEVLLEINNLSKNFGPITALQDVSLKICRGQVHGLVGENGSGKSTIYWSIYTLLESAFKINEFDVEKYFVKGTEFGLVNIHAKASQPAYIKMILKECFF